MIHLPSPLASKVPISIEIESDRNALQESRGNYANYIRNIERLL